jgi:hypothetical protein
MMWYEVLNITFWLVGVTGIIVGSYTTIKYAGELLHSDHNGHKSISNKKTSRKGRSRFSVHNHIQFPC